MSEQQLTEPAPVRPADGPADSTSTPAIELRGVVKEFRSHGESVTAVRDMNVAITEGEFFSLLGPSGCGKTTTMRMVAGFEDPTQGTVHLHGADVTLIPPHKRDVNMVFQSYALFPHMNVFDNVAGSAVIEFGGGERIIVPAADARPGDKLEITVRPEKMTLTSGGSSNPRGGEEGGAAGAGSGRENACALRGTVTKVVYLGTSTNYNVTTSAGAEV